MSIAHIVLPVKKSLCHGLSNRDRTDELVYWINERYGVEAQALRLYLSGLVRMQAGSGVPAWIVADREEHIFWGHLTVSMNALGGECKNLWNIKKLRPRYANKEVDAILADRDMNRLFNETAWRYPTTLDYRHRGKELDGQVVRRRVYVKPINGIRDDSRPELTEKLYHWAKAMSETEAVPDKLTDYQLVICEIMGKIGPYTADGMQRNMSALSAQYRAANTPIDEDEVQLQVYRTIVESVRLWDKNLIEGLSNGDGHRSIEQLSGSVKGKRKKQVEDMLMPWVENGLVDWQRKRTPRGRIVKGRWIGPTPLGWEMIKLMEGKAKWW